MKRLITLAAGFFWGTQSYFDCWKLNLHNQEVWFVKKGKY